MYSWKVIVLVVFATCLKPSFSQGESSCRIRMFQSVHVYYGLKIPVKLLQLWNNARTIATHHRFHITMQMDCMPVLNCNTVLRISIQIIILVSHSKMHVYCSFNMYCSFNNYYKGLLLATMLLESRELTQLRLVSVTLVKTMKGIITCS